jgi:hypothetical protein
MSHTQVEVGGTLQPDGTLVLDEKPNVPPGRVRVVVQAVSAPAPPQESLLEYVRRARRELEAMNYPFMNEEEVTAWVEELRADDDRIEEAYRQMEEGREQG